MARDLDQILGGVRTRLLEERDYHLVDGVALRVQKVGQVRLPRAEIDRGQELPGNGARGITGESHHSEAGAAGRSGDGNDGVGELHERTRRVPLRGALCEGRRIACPTYSYRRPRGGPPRSRLGGPPSRRGPRSRSPPPPLR